MSCGDGGPLAKERVGLIKQQDTSIFPGALHKPAQVLFRLTHILVHDLRQIRPQQRHPKLPGDGVGCHGLAGTGRAMEDSGNALPLIRDTPGGELRPALGGHADLFQLSLNRLGQYHISQRGCGGILNTKGQGTTAKLLGAPGILNLYHIVAGLCCGAKSQFRSRPHRPYRHGAVRYGVGSGTGN